jgi:hypothetical protein
MLARKGKAFIKTRIMTEIIISLKNTNYLSCHLGNNLNYKKENCKKELQRYDYRCKKNKGHISGGREIQKFNNAISAPCLLYNNKFCN